MARLAHSRDLPTKATTRIKGSRHAGHTKPEGSPVSKLGLVFSPDSTDDLMNRANAHLAARQPYHALQTYNKILISKSPGHPCAFLNRSLAHIALGYPELAVADAYRAAMASYQMRQASTISGDRMLKTVAKYTRSENLAKKSGEPWATEPTCYLGPVWLGVPLGAIFLHPGQVRLETSSRQSVCMVLELKAIYRMAYALWMCGGGALSDALGLLCDAKGSCQLTPQDEFSILSLGNQILLDISNATTREGIVDSRLDPGRLSYDLLGNAGKKEAFGVRDVMRRRYTWVKREVYPWNKYEPDLEKPSVIESLNCAIKDMALGSHLRLLLPEEGKVPRLALVSTRDIGPGSTVLTEVSSFQVTNACKGQTTSMHCNNCAASLIVPVNSKYTNTGGDWPSKPLGDAFDDSFSTTKSMSDDDEEDIAYFSQKQRMESGAALTPPGTPPKPPPHRHLHSDIKICPDCERVTFCSSHCWEQAKFDYHKVLCGVGVEKGICEAIQKHEALAHHPINAEAEQIYELLLVRVFALAKEKGIHPLALDEVRWLNGDFFAASITDDGSQLDDQGEPLDMPFPLFPDRQYEESHKTLPWSFEANVVRPIKWLTKIGLKPIENLERCDGWIINTLLAKIMASTRITRGSRHAKVYDASGRLVPGLEADLHGRAENDVDVCIGSIHPIFSHMQCVSNASDANIIVRDEGVVSCVARGVGDGRKEIPPSFDTKSTDVPEKMSSHGQVEGQENNNTCRLKAGTLITRHADAFA